MLILMQGRTIKDLPNHIHAHYFLAFSCCCRLLDHGAKLQIDSARMSDAGLYTCLMSNVAGQTNLTYKLDVFGE